jgi:hypothetical protein
MEGFTPREQDHGWWNCSDCRERLHTLNKIRVVNLLYCDMFGNHFTLEYIQNMEEWLVEREEYEDACRARDLASQYKLLQEMNIKLSQNNFY